MQAGINNQVTPEKLGHVIPGRLEQVRVDARTAQDVHVDTLAANLANHIANHADGRNYLDWTWPAIVCGDWSGQGTGRQRSSVSATAAICNKDRQQTCPEPPISPSTTCPREGEARVREARVREARVKEAQSRVHFDGPSASMRTLTLRRQEM